MDRRNGLPVRKKLRVASYLLACSVVLLSGCAPTLVAQTHELPTAPRPMTRVVVALNDQVYSRFTMHDSAMSYIQNLRDSIQRQFEQHGITVKVVEINPTNVVDDVAQAVVEIKPTHILRLYVVQTRQDSRSLTPDEANWMFDIEQEDLDAMTTVSGLPGAKHLHHFKAIYRAEYEAPACAPLIRLPNQQQNCTNELIGQFIADTHRVGLLN